MLIDTSFFIDLADELQSGTAGPCRAFLEKHRDRAFSRVPGLKVTGY